MMLGPKALLTPKWVGTFALWALLAQTIPVFALTDAYWVKSQGKSVGRLVIHSYEQDEQAAQPLHITELEQENLFKRQGKTFQSKSTSRFVEASQTGAPIRFSHEVTLANQSAGQSRGEVRGNDLQLNVDQFDAHMKGTQTIQAERFSFPTGEKIQRLFQHHYSDPEGSRFSYQTLNLSLAPELVEVEAQVEKEALFTLSDKSTQQARRFRITNPKSPNKAVYEWRNRDGKLLKAESKDQGTELIYIPMVSSPSGTPQAGGQKSSKKGAKPQQAHRLSLTKKQWALLAPANQLDVITSTLIRSNRMIPHPRQVKQGVYIIKTKSSSGEIPALITNDRQTIVPAQPSSNTPAQLKVSTGRLLYPNSLYPVAHKVGYTYPSAYIESHDPELKALAQSVTQNTPRADQAAEKLRQWVYENIASKNLTQGFLSAKTTYLKREGDCTEHAVLLAALARAIGIPSRVAVGVEYLPTGAKDTGAFVFHMWTEVFIGRPGPNGPEGNWLALDATNPESFVDATHIKFADSDLASPNAPVELSESVMAVMGNLDINVLDAPAPAYTVVTIDPSAQHPELQTQKIDIEAIDIQRLSRASILSFRTAPYQEDVETRTQEGYLAQAADALYEGRFQQASTLMDRAIQEAKVPLAQYQLATQLAALEQYDLARPLFAKSTQADPSLSGQAQAYQAEFFPNALQGPDDESAYYKAVGQVLRATPDATAISQLETMAQNAPGYTPLLLHLGEAALKLSDPDQALSWFQQAQSSALDNSSLKARALEGQALALAAKGKHQDAAQSYYQAYATCKAFQSAPGQRLAEEMYSHYLIERGRYWVASGQAANGWVSIGKGLYHQSRTLEAITAFENAVKLSPHNDEADGYLLKLVMDSSDWLDAAPIAIHLKARGPRHGMALAGLGYFYMRDRSYGKSKQYATRATVVSPTLAFGHEVLAEVALRRGERVQALKLFEKGIGVIEQGPDSLTELRYLHLLREKHAKAALPINAQWCLKTADTMIAADVLDPIGYRYKGQALLQLGRLEESKAAFSEALVLDPNNPDTLSGIGTLYAKLNQTNEALHYYEKALAVVPGHPSASRGLGYLIEAQQLNRTKPPLYTELTDDEKDYLIAAKAMRALADGIGNQLSQTQNADPSEEGVVESQDKLYAGLLKLYKEHQAMTAPESMRVYHAQLGEVIFGVLQIMSAAQKANLSMGGVLPTAEESQAQSDLQAARVSLSTHLTQLNTSNTLIMSRLHPAIQAEIKQAIGKLLTRATGNTNLY